MWQQGEKRKIQKLCRKQSNRTVLPTSHTHPRLSPPKLNAGEIGNFTILGNVFRRTKELITALYHELKVCSAWILWKLAQCLHHSSLVWQWFSALAVHYNGLENLKKQCLGPRPELLIYLVWGRHGTTKRFAGDANVHQGWWAQEI